jgi:hypothetical protein
MAAHCMPLDGARGQMALNHVSTFWRSYQHYDDVSCKHRRTLHPANLLQHVVWRNSQQILQDATCMCTRSTRTPYNLPRKNASCFLGGFRITVSPADAELRSQPSLCCCICCSVGKLGHHSNGSLQVGSPCIQCPHGTTTAATGSKTIDSCKLCAAGYGGASAASCTPCKVRGMLRQ